MAFEERFLFWFKRLFFPVLIVVASVFVLVLLIPEWREAVRAWMGDHTRTILAQAEGDLTGQGDGVTVLKVRTLDAVVLEIYENDGTGRAYKYRTRIVLPESRDGYVKFRGSSTNLVLVDLDGDGGVEIVAPTYDDNLMPRLHAYKWNPKDQVFYALPPESVKL